jgi:ubiquitin
MEQKGEFEQRPEIKPADQILLPKAKASPLPWILCAVFALIAIGLGVFIAVNGVGGEKKNNNGSNTTAEEKKPEEEPEDPDAKIAARINEIFDAVKKKMKEARIDVDKYYVDNSFPRAMDLVLKEGYVTSVETKSLVLMPKKGYEPSETDKIAIRTAFKVVLEDEGFSNTATLDSVTGFGVNEEYYSDDDGYACEFDRYDDRLTCGHISGISDNKKKAIISMIDQLRKKVNLEWVYLSYNDQEIEDSPNKPYQIIKASMIDGFVLYYRKGTDGEWVYVLSGNGIPLCEEFKQTEEMKEAFSGTDYVSSCS